MIPNQQTSVQYLLNGSTTGWFFPNKIFEASDMAITLFDTFTPANMYAFVYTGTNTFTSIDAGLTAVVSNIGVDAGCTVTLSSGGTAGWTLDLRSNVPEQQMISFKNQGAFLPDLHEDAFDAATRAIQDLKRLTYTFGLHGPDNEVQPWPTLPSAFNRQNTVQVYDAAGLPAVVSQSSFGGGGGGTPGGGVVYTIASQPSILVPATSAGVVTSFALANGFVSVYNGSSNVTANCAFSIPAAVNCTGTVNTLPNSPVVGGPQGYYTITAMTANAATLTVRAAYNGSNYDTVISIAKVLAGAAGSPGGAGPPGPTGAPGSGTTAISIYLTNPSMSVFAYANGSVASFVGVNGLAIVLSGTANVSESCTYAASTVNCTGTVNTADNIPVNGQPIGYYEVTAMSGTMATLTITAIYSGATLTQTFTVTTAQAGFEIVGTLPVTNLFQGRMVFLTTDNKLYRYTGSAWTPAVAASDVTGQLTAAQIASIATAQLTGTITTTQITPGAITTPLLAAGAVQSANIAAGTIVAGNIAANTLTAAQIAAGTITANQIASNTITTNLIQAGQITAALMSVSSLASISATLGTITAGLIQNSSGSTQFNVTSGYILFNNGSYMSVKGNGFGSSSQFLEWYGATVSSASNFAACTEANAIFYLKTNGQSAFKGLTGGNVHTYLTGGGLVGAIEVVPTGVSTCLVEIWGAGGSGSVKNVVTTCGGAGAGGYASRSVGVTPGNKFIFTQAAGFAGPIYVSGGGLNGSNGGATTVSGSPSGGAISMTANGGSGGLLGAFGAGGSASGGTTNTTGGSGTLASPGLGGASVGGTGGTNAGSGYLPYSPAGGGAADNTGTGGGAGAPGMVQFTYS